MRLPLIVNHLTSSVICPFRIMIPPQKHAYCIIAHNDPYCLQTLVNLIDDNRNDIFILYDKKCDKSQFKNISAKYSRIIYPSKELKIYWGDISQIRAELLLYETVITQNIEYSHIHLLSGADLPLHSQDYIHNFFNNLPKETNLIGFSFGDENEFDLKRKTQYRYILTRFRKNKNTVRGRLCTMIGKTWLKIQKVLDLKVDWKGYHLAKGAQWVSITMDFAKFLVSNKNSIIRKFKYVYCADEIYKQTLVLSSKFKDTVLTHDNEYLGYLRKIDWQRGNPYIWHSTDFEELINDNSLFARKFQSAVDKDIIDKIYEKIRRDN